MWFKVHLKIHLVMAAWLCSVRNGCFGRRAALLSDFKMDLHKDE